MAPVSWGKKITKSLPEKSILWHWSLCVAICCFHSSRAEFVHFLCFVTAMFLTLKHILQQKPDSPIVSVSPLHKAMQDKDRNTAEKALDWNQWLFFLLLTGTAAQREKCCGDKLSSCADLLHHLLPLDHPMAASEHSLAATANHLWNKRFCKNEGETLLVPVLSARSWSSFDSPDC